MDIIVTISAKSKNARLEDRDTIKEAAIFFASDLLKRCKDKSMILNIRLVPILVSEHDPNWLLSGEHYVTKIKGNVIHNIDLCDHVPFLELLKTLAHEIVHAVRIHKGYLIAEERWSWKGKDYGENPYQGNDNDFSLPWEIEADTKDVILARKFILNKYSIW